MVVPNKTKSILNVKFATQLTIGGCNLEGDKLIENLNRIPGKVVLAGTRFFDRGPPKKEVRRMSTIGIVREVPYVNRPPSSTTVDDGDHDFHARTRG